MALKPCPECGDEVSESASACPNCGYPIQENLAQAALRLRCYYQFAIIILIGVAGLLAVLWNAAAHH
jgi:hypothetical protein